jgi:hypothetical protein
MKRSRRLVFLCLYTASIFAITPYLPALIRTASSRWSSSRVSQIVLGLEIVIAFLILALATRFLILKRKKSTLFLLSVSAIFLFSFIIYKIYIPNPYEFTHLPEYAILSILIIRAINKEKRENSILIKNSYFLTGLISGVIGAGDEMYQYFLPDRFFNWYDILLNILGGILGLLIFWGKKR